MRRRGRAAPAVVATDELIEAHWPHADVGDHARKTVVGELRKALGDDARHARYIETVPNVGTALWHRLTRRYPRLPAGVMVSSSIAPLP